MHEDEVYDGHHEEDLDEGRHWVTWLAFRDLVDDLRWYDEEDGNRFPFTKRGSDAVEFCKPDIADEWLHYIQEKYNWEI